MRRAIVCIVAACSSPSGSPSSTAVVASASAITASPSVSASAWAMPATSDSTERIRAFWAKHDKKGDVVQVADIFKAYGENAVRAENERKGKPVIVIDVVDSVGKGPSGVFLWFSAKQEGDRYGTLTKNLAAFLDESDRLSMGWVADVRPGDIIEVACDILDVPNDDSVKAHGCTMIQAPIHSANGAGSATFSPAAPR
jgi:hypothetical protein